jgi:hypothetical protein
MKPSLWSVTFGLLLAFATGAFAQPLDPPAIQSRGLYPDGGCFVP